MNALRCPVCGGSHITPATPLTGEHTQLMFVTNPQGGVFSKGAVVASPGLGCICLDCGYVMTFVGPAGLERLRQAAATLHPNQ
jgi:hypothetical protein